MQPSPYDENWNLDTLAVEAQLQQAASIFTTNDAAAAVLCGGCGADLVGERVDERGRSVRDFACGHRYVIGLRTVSIERTLHAAGIQSWVG